MAETDLTVLLRTMEPELFAEPYGYAVCRTGRCRLQPFATVAEARG